MNKYICIVCILLSSCVFENSSKLSTQERLQLNLFKREVMENGNIDAYEKLIDLAIRDGGKLDILGYSMIMSNQFNYPKAYYDTYFALAGDSVSLSYLDNKSKNLALYYLLKANELGYKKTSEIKKNFGDSLPSSYYFLEKWAKEEKEK